MLFALLLAPISLVFEGDGVSANYLFLFMLLLAPRGYRVNPVAFAYLGFCLIAWAIGVVIFSQGDAGFIVRQAISAMLWSACILLLLVRIPFTIEEVCAAAVLAGTVYSVYVVWTVVSHGIPITDVYFIKGDLRNFVPDWPQRYVVVLMFAFFVAMERSRRGVIWMLSALAILACIFLTFTRAAWIGVVAGLLGYLWLSRTVGGGQPREPMRWSTRITRSLIAVGVVVFVATSEVVLKAFMIIYDHFALVTAVLFSGDGFDAQGSVGTRLEIWRHIQELVERSPLTGTGFAGADLLIEGTGSAHSQYMDILLRTGLVGMAFFVFFWAKLLIVYARRSPGMVGGLLAIAVFGFFQESIKLSYGALLFFVLLNKAYEFEHLDDVVARSGS